MESILGTATPTHADSDSPCQWLHGALLPLFSGEGAVGPNDPNRESALSQLAKTTISLTLTSKFELLDGDDKDLKTLMTKSVQWIVGRRQSTNPVKSVTVRSEAKRVT